MRADEELKKAIEKFAEEADLSKSDIECAASKIMQELDLYVTSIKDILEILARELREFFSVLKDSYSEMGCASYDDSDVGLSALKKQIMMQRMFNICRTKMMNQSQYAYFRCQYRLSRMNPAAYIRRLPWI